MWKWYKREQQEPLSVAKNYEDEESGKVVVNGAGLSARPNHFEELQKGVQNIRWLEILADNFIDRPNASKPLEKLAEKYPLVFHCTGMSLASTDPVCRSYLKKVKKLQKVFCPEWLSDHLCWVSHNGEYLHDLIPIPKNEESLKHLCKKIHTIQDFFGEALVVENITEYLCYPQSHISDAKFIGELLSQTGCELLLDVSNLYINSFNHGWSASKWLHELASCVPSHKIRQIHLAAYHREKNYLLDTHEGEIQKEVWSLYKKTLDLFGPIPTCLEWDKAVPPLKEVLPEINKIREMQALYNSHSLHSLHSPA